MRIVIIRLDHLGDTLLCTPMIRSLAKAGHEVHLVLAEQSAPIFMGNPHVSVVTSIGHIDPDFPGKWWRLGRWLRQQRFDALLLPYAAEPRLLFASLMSGIPTRIAMWSRVLGRLTFHTCLRSRIMENPRCFADIMLDLSRFLGAAPDGVHLDLFVPEAVDEWARKTLDDKFRGGRVVGIHPGCGGSACNLPPDAYGKVADLVLSDDRCVVVVTGAQAEKGLLAQWPAQVMRSPRLWNAMGELSLHRLAAVIKRMDVYVVPSTGPLHVANWAGTTTVSPFCAYPSLSAAVWGNNNGRGVTLAPSKEYCVNRRRHEGHCDFMGQLGAETVYREVRRSLQR